MIASSLVAAFLLDAMVGDPPWLPHPVRWIGRVIAWIERGVCMLVQHPLRAKLVGIGVAVGFPMISFTVVWGSLHVADQISTPLGPILEILWSFLALAGRDLADHAWAVWRALDAGSLNEARSAVARIVGRDTHALPEPEVVRATVETVAESTCDGIVAPLFFLALGGPPLAWAYKTVNTLDSMIGHPEHPYRDVGWASARLDDAMNWLPARLTGWLIVSAAGIRFLNCTRVHDAWVVFRRDGGKHRSPNSGRPEAAMAGALGVQLGGVNVYDGTAEVRPSIGTADQPLTRDRIAESVAVMWIASVLAAGLAWGAVWCR